MTSREFKPSFKAKTRIGREARVGKFKNYAEEQMQEDEVRSRLQT